MLGVDPARGWIRRSFSRTALALAVNVPLTYETSVPPGGHGDLDTPAVWIGPQGESLLYVTDKTQDWVEIHDASSNEYLGRLGGTGSGPGQLSRPNAVAVATAVDLPSGTHDLLLVVERDNHRVSAFDLPSGLFYGSFGAGVLQEPMGVALHREGGTWQVWVTDIGTSPQRVVVFEVVASPEGIGGTQLFAFDTPDGSILESIAVDGAQDRVLVCDESAFDVMVFDLAGNFVRRFGAGLFTDDPEGIAIYDSGGGTGYVIVTDQVASPTEWEVFDRQDLRYLLHFSGATQGTDGVALVQAAFPGFPHGAFFAVHADRAVHAYAWDDVGAATGLCVEPPCAPVGVGLQDAGAVASILGFASPLHGAGSLHLELRAPVGVDVVVYDLRGACVARLARGVWPAGRHAIAWDGRGKQGDALPTGIYLVRTRAGPIVRTQKVTLLH